MNAIKFAGRNSKRIEVYLKDIDIFNTPTVRLLQEISESTSSDYEEEEQAPEAYVFPSIDLSVDRGYSIKQHNTIPESEEGKYFWTIGIGAKGYCSSIREQLRALED